jgi:hypothetical protein
MDIFSGIETVVFVWFILVLIKPQKFASFFKSGARKKAFAVFMAVGIVCGMLGGKPSDQHKGSHAGTTKQEQKKAPVYKIGDTVKGKNFEICVLDKSAAKEVSDESGYLKNTANGKYIVLHVRFKNVAKEAKRLDNSAFTIKKGDVTYSPATLVVRTDKNIFLTTINPGVEKVGELYFDVPEDVANAKDLVLHMSGFAFASDNGDGNILLQ